MRCTVALAAAIAALLAAGPVSAQQQIGRDFTIVNSWRKEIGAVRMQAVGPGSQPVPGSMINSIARDLAPGAHVRAHVEPGANAKYCTWAISFDIPGGGGGGMLDLCGKTRIVLSGTDPDFPQLAAE